jgi:predicted  nucleic acid-binding Zn-ribbon protein
VLCSSSIANDISKLEVGTSQIDSLKKANEELQNLLNQSREEKKSSEEKIIRLTADLEALSQAYTALEEHSTELKRRNEKLEREYLKSLENESAMEDLLVCLGQEEEKVKNLEAEVEKLRVSR